MNQSSTIHVTASLELGAMLANPKVFAEKLDQAVRKTAREILSIAKEGCPVDTGALKASIYMVDRFGEHGMDAALSISSKLAGTVSNRRPLRSSFQFNLPEVQAQPLEAYVIAGAAYGPYVEFGTGNMPAQPFMMPAAHQGETLLIANIYAALAGIGWGLNEVAGAK